MSLNDIHFQLHSRAKRHSSSNIALITLKNENNLLSKQITNLEIKQEARLKYQKILIEKLDLVEKHRDNLELIEDYLTSVGVIMFF